MQQVVTYQELEHHLKTGAPADLVKTTLNCYGFAPAPSKTNPNRWSHPHYPELSCAVDPTKSIAGEGLKNIIGLCKTAAARGQRVEAVMEPLPGWVPELLPENYEASLKEGVLKVWDAAYPELPFSMRLNASASRSVEALGSSLTGGIQQIKLMLPAHEKLLEGIEEEYAICFERKNNQLLIPSESGVTWSTDFSDGSEKGNRKLFDNIYAAKSSLDDYILKYMDKLETLESHGFLPDPSDAAETQMNISRYTHRNLTNPLTLTQLGKYGRLSRIDSEKLDHAIIESKTSHSPAGPKRLLFHDYTHRDKNPVDSAEQVALVMDACALNDLAMMHREPERGGTTRTWLDLIPVIADLDRVDRIMIPSTIADWECCGSLTENNNLKIVDDNFRSGELFEKAKPLTGLFAIASRYRVEDDGTWTCTKHGNPHVVICETSFDRDVAKKIRAKYPKGGIIEKSLRDELRDSGEQAMEYLAKRIDSTSPVFLVSTDFVWMNKRKTQRQQTRCETTPAGKAIGELSLRTFMDEVCATHHDELKERLGKAFGVAVKDGPMEDAMAEAKDHSYQSHGCRGLDHEGNLGDSLAGILQGPISKVQKIHMQDAQKSKISRSGWIG